MASVSPPNPHCGSPRLPRPQTQASILLPSSSSSSSSLSLAAASSADGVLEASSPPPLPPLPQQQTQRMTLSSSYYSDILRFEPPRSSSSYALHDYSSSPVRGEEDDEEEGEGIPPVPPVDWPLPAGRVLRDVVIPIRAGFGVRESMTALPVPFMTEVYRPRPRPGPRTGSLDMLRLATTSNDGAGGVVAPPVVDALFDGSADSAGPQSDEKRSLRQRIRKWFHRNSRSSVPSAPPTASPTDGPVPTRLRKRRQHSEPINPLTYFGGQASADRGPPGRNESASGDMSFLEALRTTPPGCSSTVPTMPYAPQPSARPKPRWVPKEAGRAPAGEEGPRMRQARNIAAPRHARDLAGPRANGSYGRGQTQSCNAMSDTHMCDDDTERRAERLRKQYEALRVETEKLRTENDELRRSNNVLQSDEEGLRRLENGPPQ